MNKYRISFRRTVFGGTKKISDIRDFREMTRNPFTSACATLVSAKAIVEAILDAGGSPVTIEVTPEECAVILINWMKDSFCPDGWYLEPDNVEPVRVDPPALSIAYYS